MDRRYFVGADVGGTKTRLVIADESGNVIGFGQAGPGNHETVGYEGLRRVLLTAFEQACPAGFPIEQICGAGFGIGGYDFPSETMDTLNAIAGLGLKCPVSAVNDSIIGLVAGSPDGWGVAVVSGTGCNCWGWDQTRQRVGHVTGYGMRMGEGAGSSEVVEKAIQAVAYEWTKRGPATQISRAFIRHTGARDLSDLIEGIVLNRYQLEADAAPLVFRAAEGGDAVAREIIRWAGCELGELAKAVMRQLDFQDLEFNVVLVGSMYDGGPALIDEMSETIHAFAPRAKLVRLYDQPVLGAVILGMEAAGTAYSAETRRRLSKSMLEYLTSGQ
jgi:N-acetylglucosamine kinase-like BadF-type ATPase